MYWFLHSAMGGLSTNYCWLYFFWDFFVQSGVNLFPLYVCILCMHSLGKSTFEFWYNANYATLVWGKRSTWLIHAFYLCYFLLSCFCSVWNMGDAIDLTADGGVIKTIVRKSKSDAVAPTEDFPVVDGMLVPVMSILQSSDFV